MKQLVNVDNECVSSVGESCTLVNASMKGELHSKCGLLLIPLSNARAVKSQSRNAVDVTICTAQDAQLIGVGFAAGK